jgi:hypothetical protein
MGCGLTRCYPLAVREVDGTLSINWRSLQLKSVTSDELRLSSTAPDQVESLRLAENFLEDLPLDLHEIFPSLTLIDLSGNTFMQLPSTIRGMRRLRTIILDNNTLESDVALTNLPSSTEILSLVCCGLRHFPKDFTRCTVTSLDLSKTVMPLEDPDVFSALANSLTSLIVADCHFKSIPLGVQALSLTFLDVSRNGKLSLADVDMFGAKLPLTLVDLKASNILSCELPSMLRLCNLVKVDLSETSILNVTSSFLLASSLSLHSRNEDSKTELSFLESSELYSKNAATADGMKRSSRVEILMLARCGISLLPLDVGSCFETLTELDLSYNSRLEIARNNNSLLRLVNLVHIRLVGCDSLLASRDGRDSVWFQLSTLRRLSVVELREAPEVPVRVPVPLLSCPLRLLDGVHVETEAVCGKGLESLRIVASPSSTRMLKPTFCFDISTVNLQLEAIKRLGDLESFFLVAQNPLSPASLTTNTKRLQTAVWRYSFYLLAQSHQEDLLIVPPLDVALLHVAHAMMAPADYCALCMELPRDLLPHVVEPLGVPYMTSLADPQLQSTMWNRIKRSREEALESDQNLLIFDFQVLQGDVSEPKYEKTLPKSLTDLSRARTGLFEECIKKFFRFAEQCSRNKYPVEVLNSLDERFALFLSDLPVLSQEVAAADCLLPTSSTATAAPSVEVELALMIHRATPVRHVNLLRHLKVGHPTWI